MSPRAVTPLTKPPDVVCLSSADWDAVLWTNKQHLMSRLAMAGVRVLYIDSLGYRAPRPSRQDTSRIFSRLRAWRPFAHEVERHLYRDSPLVLPFHGSKKSRAVNAWLLTRRLQRNLARRDFDRPVFWTYVPGAVDLYDPKRFRALVYHCVDRLATFPGVDPQAFEEQEARLVEKADLCIASSRQLQKHLEERGARGVLYWPNPADTVSFSAASSRAREDGHVRVGFIGAVQEHKLDVDLLRRCAELRPDWRFELVGPVGIGLRETSLRPEDFPPNVHFLGAVDRSSLPSVVSGFDVGIIPYAINHYTASVFPMKVFEYLSAGLPVVATPLPSLVGEIEHVAFASDAEEFVAAVESAARTRDAGRDARIEYARPHSWEKRIEQVLDVLNALGSDDKVPKGT